MRHRKMEVCVWSYSETYPDSGRGFQYKCLFFGENVFKGALIAFNARIAGIKNVKVTYR